MPAVTTIQIRRGTAAAWTSANPVLALGEPGLETDTDKIKYGDGSTAWSSLPYFVGTGLSTTLTSAHLYVGNGSNVATDVAASGDLTLANTGAFTVAKIAGTTVSGTTGSGNVVFSTSPTLVTPALGTPSALVLTNATGLPVAGGGTGAATLTGVVIGNGTSAFTTVTAPSGAIVGTTDTQTLTNKRITNRVLTITSSATPAIDTDNYDCVTITALATAITSMTTSLTGTPNDFDSLIFRIKDNGTARAITWGASFVAEGVALPTTTVISKVLTVGFIYDSVKVAWGCVAVANEA